MGEELPALAKEVARVEAVRAYTGEFLKQLLLDFQVGIDSGKEFDMVIKNRIASKRIVNV